MVQFEDLPPQNRVKPPIRLLSRATRRPRIFKTPKNTQIVYQRPAERAELFLHSLLCLLYLHVNPVYVPDPYHI